MSIDRPWSYRPESGHKEGQDLTGFTVEATDGTVGQVDRQADVSDMRHLVVETGVWVFGKSVLVPSGAVTGIDPGARQITLAFTRDEVKAAPLFRTDSETRDPDYLGRVDAYYRALPPRQPA
ncbi:PRC-barrel domain containing protein [Streptomyces sp. NPDC091292]|uniref:PRC-barrel domain containing protein n=1 Tax=Streptomyces sp. NPDC091292 TaxID=3365991 RepID=UPI0038063C0A